MHEKLSLNTEADKPQDHCAVVGVFSRTEDVSRIALEGLIELNHRGQEGAGIVVSNGNRFKEVKDSGLAETVFYVKHKCPPQLKGAFIAIGQDRYSTSGSLDEMQPFIEDGIALAHNGNLTNVQQLKEEFNLPDEIDGARSDSRVGLAVINKMPGAPEERILRTLPRLEGAFSLVISTQDALYASRDSHGFRPLTIGKLKDGGYAVMSETAALRLMGAKFFRDVEPGETIRIDDNGVTTIALDKKKLSQCIFELVYIARIDSKVFGIPVAEFRRRQGEILARHLPEWVEYIAPVPNSGRGAGLGVIASELVKASGITPTEVFYPNPYKNTAKRGPRTFILPNERDKAATEKYSVIESNVRGRNLILVEDSIVRGSMLRQVQILRAHGAEKIGALIAFPPIRHACGYGVDFGRVELIANKEEVQVDDGFDIDKIRQLLRLDYLYYISNNELLEAALGNPVEIKNFEDSDFCGACFTGKYPVPIEGTIAKT